MKKELDMELEQKRSLYIKDNKVIREYDIAEVFNIDDSGIVFNDGRVLDFKECGNCFPIEHPYGRKYIGARFTGAFWQFFTNEMSIVVLCNDRDDTLKILSHIGFMNSYDLS